MKHAQMHTKRSISRPRIPGRHHREEGFVPLHARGRLQVLVFSFLLIPVLLFIAGCGSDPLWAPSTTTRPEGGDGSFLDRMEEDFERGTTWSDTDGGLEGWALVDRPDRPTGDARVLSYRGPEDTFRPAIWHGVTWMDNNGASFQVEALSETPAWMGILIHHQPNGSCYLFRVQPGTSLWELKKIEPGGERLLAGGLAEDSEPLIRTSEFVRLRLGWSVNKKDLLEAAVVSPTTGVHLLARVSVDSPLKGGQAGVYASGTGVSFDSARMTGRVRTGQPAVIEVHADRILGRIPKELFGVNFMWRGENNGIPTVVYDELEHRAQVDRWFRLLDVLHPVGIGSTRYPGGIDSLLYYWKHGVGPASSRGNVSGTETITLGTDEFLRFTEELGAEALITLNPVFLGLPLGDPAVARYAADWVEYCNAPNDGSNPGGGIDYAALRAMHGHEAPYGVTYWEIGNELGGLGAEEFGGIIRSISDATRAVDPTIELGFQDHFFSEPYMRDPFSPSVREYYTNDRGTGILDLAGDRFDFWQIHPYGPALLDIGAALFQNGAELTVTHNFVQSGHYLFRLRGFSTHPSDTPVRGHRYATLHVRLDGEPVWDFEVSARGERDWEQEIFVPRAGPAVLSIVGDNLLGERTIFLTNRLEVVHRESGRTEVIDLTNSEQLYDIIQATAPHVGQVFFDMFKEYYGEKPGLATEWNTSTGFYDAPNDLKWALSNADYLNTFVRNQVPLTAFWNLTADTLLVGLLEGVERDRPDPRLRPTAYVFQLYRRLLKGDRVEVTVQAPFYLRGVDGVRLGIVGDLGNFRIPYLSAVAALSPARDILSLIVVNKHRELALSAEVNILGFTPSASGTRYQISAETISTNNEREGCPDPGDCVKTVASPWRGNPESFNYLFPPHSVTAFTFCTPGGFCEPPGPPSNLRAEVEGRTVSISWEESGSPAVVGYSLYRSRQPQGPYGNRIDASPIQDTHYVDRDLDPSQTYVYAVTAVDPNGNESDFSNRVAVHVEGRLPHACYPVKLTVDTGVLDGGLQALAKADHTTGLPPQSDAYCRIESVRGSVDWTVELETKEPAGALSALAIYHQALYNRSGSEEFLLWNTRRGRWDRLRSVPVSAGQIERYMEAFPGPDFVRDHTDDDGHVRLRVRARLGGTFTCYADYVALTVR